MAEPLVAVPQDHGALQPEANSSTSSGDICHESQAKAETHGDAGTQDKSDHGQFCTDRMSDSTSPCSSSMEKTDDTNHMSATEETSNNASNVNISAPQVIQDNDVNTPLNCDTSVSCDSKDGAVQQDVKKSSRDVNNVNADPQQNLNRVDLPGIFAPEHFGNSCDRNSHTRSMSEGSSGSEDECRRMEVSHIDSDTGSSSVSPRDHASSEVSSEDPLADLETLRQCTSSVMSDVSSYSWMREGTMGSVISVDPDSALGRIRADIAAQGSIDGKGQPGVVSAGQIEGVGDVKPTTQLTNELVEGPTVTLPSSESLPPKPLTVTPAADIQESAMPAHEPSLPQTQGGGDANSNAPNQKNVNQPDSSPNVSVSQSSDASTESKQLKVAAESKASTSAEATKPPSPARQRVKKTPNDFIFGKVIGEGSYSTVSIKICLLQQALHSPFDYMAL